MTSFKSAVAMLGDPAEVFTYGTQFFTFNLGYLIGIVLGLILYIPVFYDLNQISLFKVSLFFLVSPIKSWDVYKNA